MVRYLFYTIGDLTYQSPLVQRGLGNENGISRTQTTTFLTMTPSESFQAAQTVLAAS